jgi:hypothetical protein
MKKWFALLASSVFVASLFSSCKAVGVSVAGIGKFIILFIKGIGLLLKGIAWFITQLIMYLVSD